MNTHSFTQETATRVQTNADAQSEVAKTVGREILESRLDPAAWATALAESGGNRQQAVSHYARIRMESLALQLTTSVAKIASLERRRLKQCLGGPLVQPAIAGSVREMLDRPRRERPLNFPKPSLSPLWLAILWVGSTGMTATCGQLLVAHLAAGIASHLVMISALCGLAVVGGALLLRLKLPKPWIQQGWNAGLVAICHLVCLSSLFLGTKVIKRSMATASMDHPIQRVAAAPVRSAEPAPKPAPKASPQLSGGQRLVSAGYSATPVALDD
ncbi:MAG: hypothetical protein K9N23_12825 [Akkermansiaceae bacterium]|nr:hypothetical protein [Akkermansiaceae bacterium]